MGPQIHNFTTPRSCRHDMNYLLYSLHGHQNFHIKFSINPLSCLIFGYTDIMSSVCPVTIFCIVTVTTVWIHNRVNMISVWNKLFSFSVTVLESFFSDTKFLKGLSAKLVLCTLSVVTVLQKVFYFYIVSYSPLQRGEVPLYSRLHRFLIILVTLHRWQHRGGHVK